MFTASNCKSLCACLCCRLETKNMKNENSEIIPRIPGFKVYRFGLEEAFCNVSLNYSLLLLPHGKLQI